MSSQRHIDKLFAPAVDMKRHSPRMELTVLFRVVGSYRKWSFAVQIARQNSHLHGDLYSS
jgi:hypothetical protein